MRVYIVRHGEDTVVMPGNWKLVPVALFDVLRRRKRDTRHAGISVAERDR